jgi:hypothetical protein
MATVTEKAVASVVGSSTESRPPALDCDLMAEALRVPARSSEGE